MTPAARGPWPAAVLPLALLALLAGAFLTLKPLDPLTSGAPPIESLVVERVALGPAGITARVRSVSGARGGGSRSQIRSSSSATPSPVLAEQKRQSPEGSPSTDSISRATSSGRAAGRSILFTTGISSRSWSTAR